MEWFPQIPALVVGTGQRWEKKKKNQEISEKSSGEMRQAGA